MYRTGIIRRAFKSLSDAFLIPFGISGQEHMEMGVKAR
jgi:hypothetical protein